MNFACREVLHVDVYIARQPIYDRTNNLYAYELLYRDALKNSYSESMDGSQATCFVLSDAITVFGMQQLTNGKSTFVNFTKDILMSDFAMIAKPNDIVIEILETVVVDETIINRVKELKDNGYKIAIDDYTGDRIFDQLLPYADIVKVDFMLCGLKKAGKIAKKLSKLKLQLLAEKVETFEEFEKAKTMGYSLFQGYYFARPHIMTKKTVDIADSSFIRIIRELEGDVSDYSNIAKIIETDATLTYQLLSRVNTLRYTQSTSRVMTIRRAIVQLGLEEFRRWIILMMARQFVKNESEEVIRVAFIRALFAEKLAFSSPTLRTRSKEAFIMGMLSLIDVIIGQDMETLLPNIPLSDEVRDAILGKENSLKEVLDFVCLYESGKWAEVQKEESESLFTVPNLGACYLECITYADRIFNITEKQ